MSCPFKIARNGNLTGSFRANASLGFFVQTDAQFEQDSPGSIPASYYYGLANVTNAILDVPLAADSYYILFLFTYKYPVVSPVSGTGYSGLTSLNITETFVIDLD